MAGSDARSTSAVKQWLEKWVCPLLAQLVPADEKRLAAAMQRLERRERESNEDVSICFLGAAGVGKSTMLNAILDDHIDILPHGGVGSLTAQATEVRFADAPYLRARYFGKKTVHQIAFALEQAHERSLRQVPVSDDLRAELSPEEIAAARALEQSDEPDAHRAVSATLDDLARQSRLMVCNNPNAPAELPYLLDALRVILGRPTRWGTTMRDEDRPRAARITAVLAGANRSGWHFETSSTARESPEFLVAVREHASQFLAPLIQSLEIGWPSPLLKDGLVLIDLPGVGIANDAYRDVTRRYMAQARAVVLVLGDRGVDEASIDVLREAGFFQRLLHETADDDDHVVLALVMTKVDLPAHAAFNEEKALNPGSPPRRRAVHLKEKRELGAALLRTQIAAAFDRDAAAAEGDASKYRREARDRVLKGLHVESVSTTEFRKCIRADDDDHAFIASADESGIPAWKESLARIARDFKSACAERRNEALGDVSTLAESSVLAVKHNWEQATRAEEEARALERDIDVVIAPLRSRLDSQRGAYQEFLSKTVPSAIDAQVSKATDVARTALEKYLRDLESLHWATLRATARRGGAHVTSHGRKIHLCDDLSQIFEEPIANVWTRDILVTIQDRSKGLGDEYASQVGQVVAWAEQHSARVQKRHLVALHEALTADMKELRSVGHDAVGDLRKKVRGELGSRLEKRVTQSCRAFIDDKSRSTGAGVRGRILRLFRDELVDVLTSIARPTAVDVLTNNYADVRTEILAHFADYPNPLDRARATLVDSHEDSVRRSDASRRKRVLDQVEEVLAARPRGLRQAS